MKEKISIIGKGNVGTHLYEALKPAADVCLTDSRTLTGLPPESSICLICVSDSAIPEVASRLKGMAEIIAHTSGSIPMDVLAASGENYGVFYPLQTFTKGVSLNYSDIPFFIEGNNAQTTERLSRLAALISGKVIEADSEKRRQLHLASVFACNFANHLVKIADDILKPSGMDYTLLLPLLRQTVGKLNEVSPSQAQTGPAARKDYPVIEKHLSLLENNKTYQEIYRLMTENIIASRQ
ncbi:MAG: DUF2520 domain-containing protein [Muribaculaceae bacterium]|nr:DUF2520 domain-containing protein [Muribaculaceae bacterium]